MPFSKRKTPPPKPTSVIITYYTQYNNILSKLPTNLNTDDLTILMYRLIDKVVICKKIVSNYTIYPNNRRCINPLRNINLDKLIIDIFELLTPIVDSSILQLINNFIEMLQNVITTCKKRIHVYCVKYQINKANNRANVNINNKDDYNGLIISEPDDGGWLEGSDTDNGGWLEGSDTDNGGWGVGSETDNGGYNGLIISEPDDGGWLEGSETDNGGWGVGSETDNGG